MARSKNSPALFEVIRNAQQKQKEQLERQRQQELSTSADPSAAAALLRSPLYWFKGKHAHDAVHGIPAAPVMRETHVAELVDEPTPRHIVAETFPEEAEEITVEETVTTEPAAPIPAPPLRSVSSIAAEHARQVREELAAQDTPASEPLFGHHAEDDVKADPADSSVDRYLNGQSTGQIAIRFSYTTAALAGLGIFAVLVVVYIIGSASRSHGDRVATNIPRGDVLNVSPDSTAKNNAPDARPTQQADDRLAPRADAGGGARTLGLDTLGHAIPVPTNVKRVIGLQYVVLLSFPRAEDARELVKFLADNGVPATAEKALPGYSPSWYSVVTTRGFDHVRRNPEYDSYVAAISKLMQKYARGSKFRTFQPDVYTWRGN